MARRLKLNAKLATNNNEHENVNDVTTPLDDN